MKLQTDNLKYCQDAIEMKKNIEGGFVDLGEYLYNIKEHNLYEPQWSSFLEFCYELRMSQNVINKLIQVYKMFILDYGLKKEELTTAGVSLIYDVLPAIRSKKDAQHWLAQASLLTRSDLRKELTEHKTGVPMAKCKHKDTYHIEICRDCGDRKQIE